MTPASAARDVVAATPPTLPVDPSRAAVRAEKLVRAFGRRRVLDEVSFSLESGECLSIFGPNGAGKTTLLRVLAGLLKPTAGIAEISGTRLPAGAEVRQLVGVVSHHSMLYDALTARENVLFAAQLYGIHDARGAADRALERLRVADRAQTPVRLLSRGLRQRVSLARAVVHDPTVLLLDEPYTGLYESGSAALTGMLRELRDAGATMLLVTHNVQEGLAVATHAGVMRAGRMESITATATLDAATFAAEYRRLGSVA